MPLQMTRDAFSANEQCVIGEYTYGVPSVEHFEPGVMLKIGKFCSIANSAKILLGGEHPTDTPSTYPFAHFDEAFPGAGQVRPGTRGDVVIGNDVWIGAGALILSGAVICDGAVIGARAVVRKWVPPYSIVVGNPAAKIGGRFDGLCHINNRTVARLLNLKWWDWPIEKIQRYADLLCHGPVEEFLERAEAEG